MTFWGAFGELTLVFLNLQRHNLVWLESLAEELNAAKFFTADTRRKCVKTDERINPKG